MSPDELKHMAETETEAQAHVSNGVKVCLAAGCLSSQSQQVKDSLDKEVANRGWKDRCQIKGVGCMGLCAQGPLVSTGKGVVYQRVSPDQSGEILDHLEGE